MHRDSNLNDSLLTAFVFVLLAAPASCYIDIEMPVVTSSADVALNMPLTLNSIEYHLAVSLENKEEFLVAPTAMPHHKRTTKHSKDTRL